MLRVVREQDWEVRVTRIDQMQVSPRAQENGDGLLPMRLSIRLVDRCLDWGKAWSILTAEG